MKLGMFNLSDDEDRARLFERLAQLKGDYAIEVKKPRGTKSMGYLFGKVYHEIALALQEVNGEMISEDQVHEFMKDQLLRNQGEAIRLEVDGTPIAQLRPSLTRLDFHELWDYIERCRYWAAEMLGIYIPDPDPEWRTNERECQQWERSRGQLADAPEMAAAGNG